MITLQELPVYLRFFLESKESNRIGMREANSFLCRLPKALAKYANTTEGLQSICIAPLSYFSCFKGSSLPVYTVDALKAVGYFIQLCGSLGEVPVVLKSKYSPVGYIVVSDKVIFKPENRAGEIKKWLDTSALWVCCISSACFVDYCFFRRIPSVGNLLFVLTILESVIQGLTALLAFNTKRKHIPLTLSSSHQSYEIFQGELGVDIIKIGGSVSTLIVACLKCVVSYPIYYSLVIFNWILKDWVLPLFQLMIIEPFIEVANNKYILN